jgi:hypothetical protein
LATVESPASQIVTGRVASSALGNPDSLELVEADVGPTSSLDSGPACDETLSFVSLADMPEESAIVLLLLAVVLLEFDDSGSIAVEATLTPVVFDGALVVESL